MTVGAVVLVVTMGAFLTAKIGMIQVRSLCLCVTLNPSLGDLSECEIHTFNRCSSEAQVGKCHDN